MTLRQKGSYLGKKKTGLAIRATIAAVAHGFAKQVAPAVLHVFHVCNMHKNTKSVAQIAWQDLKSTYDQS
jgi:hypothetical protein